MVEGPAEEVGRGSESERFRKEVRASRSHQYDLLADRTGDRVLECSGSRAVSFPPLIWSRNDDDEVTVHTNA